MPRKPCRKCGNLACVFKKREALIAPGSQVLESTPSSSIAGSMSTQGWRQNELDASLWQAMFYTKYTTVRTAIITPILVAFMFVVLRAAGTRTLTQATLFNRIVSVAVGSLVGSVALRPNTPLTSTVLGTFIIVGAALLVDVAYAYKLVPPGFVQAEPVLVYADGRMQQHQLHRCLLTADKVASEVHGQGYSSLAKVAAVVLEPNGRFSVISQDAARDGLELLQGVRGFSEHMRHVAQTAAGGRYPAGAAGEEGRKPLAQHDSSIADLSIDTNAEAV